MMNRGGQYGESSKLLNISTALEGAIQGMRCHSLSDEVKQELKEFHKLLKNKRLYKLNQWLEY